MKRLAFALMIAVLPLTSCASLEPKACTPEWFDYKSEKTLRKFAMQNRGLVNDLRALAKADGKVDAMKALGLVTRAKDFNQLAKSFESTVLPELDTAMEQCGSSAEFGPAFTGFLRDEGVSEDVLEWVTPFINLMQGFAAAEAAEKPVASAPK